MNEKFKNIIDSHVHLDLIARDHPHRIQWLKENYCTVVSWSYFDEIDTVEKLAEGLKSKAMCIKRLSSTGLDCYYLAGVHPRCIPPDLTPEDIAPLLEPYMSDPLCKGIGEIGLENGHGKEQEILAAQLAFGRSILDAGKVIGVHTPRSNKAAIARITLDILRRFQDLSSSLVVDHCTPKTIHDVLDAGFWAGVTLSPAKTSWDELKQMASTCSDHMDRIMCNTDSGSVFFEDVVKFSRNNNLPEVVREKIFYRNAKILFGLP